MTITIPIHPERRIVIKITAQEDKSLPSPCEIEDWQPAPLLPTEIRPAIEEAIRQFTG